MEVTKIEAAIEAILFAMGEALPLSKIAKVLELEEANTYKIIQNMMGKYASEERGIQIIELDNAFQLSTKREYYEYLIQLAKQPKKYMLTDVQLEVLSIVAYKQPVTKLEIEKIRGVKSDHAVNRLVEYGLVTEFGRLDAPGKPILFGTTEEFLRRFKVQSIKELPGMSQEQLEDFKQEAEEEVQFKFDG